MKPKPRKETVRLVKVEIPDYKPPFEGEIIGFPRKPSKLPWVLVLLTLMALVGYHMLSMKKIREQEQTIDSLIELLEEVTNPLPQGNGEIQTPGVLPPKGLIDPRTIINADIITYTF